MQLAAVYEHTIGIEFFYTLYFSGVRCYTRIVCSSKSIFQTADKETLLLLPLALFMQK